jgi:glutaconate CoA-transferase, subunit A
MTPFSNPSAEAARASFATKPRGLIDKRMSVPEAVARFVADGAYLALGGFGMNRIPSAVIREIVRQKKQNLSFAGHTSTHDFQVLCAGNLTGRGQLLARVDAAYIVGLEARGLSPQARRVMQSGTVEVCEWTNHALAVRLQAASMGLPFLPMKSLAGTDTFARSAAIRIDCPFTGERLTAVPALYPDVVAIHVHEADCYGNARIRGVTVSDLEKARASKNVILTCERIIPTEAIRSEPHLTAIPFFCVDAVCEVPGGSYPGNMAGEYFADDLHLQQWMEAERDDATYRKFLDEYLFGPANFAAYLERCGGASRLNELRQLERGL